MKKKKAHIRVNDLVQMRKSKNLTQSEVAAFLGRKSASTLSYYESGVRTPDLRSVLKLAQIYEIPVMSIISWYADAWTKSIRIEESIAHTPRSIEPALAAENADDGAGCPFERMLITELLDDLSLRRIRLHSANLIRKTAEKMGHI